MSKHLLDTDHGYIFQGGLDLFILHLLFTVTLSGSKYSGTLVLERNLFRKIA